MANINLFRSVQNEETSVSSDNNVLKFGKNGFLIPFLFLFLSLAIYGGIIGYSKFIVKAEIVKLDEQISAESKNLLGKDTDRLADFKDRLDGSTKANNAKSYPNDFFDELKKLVVPGSQVSSIKYKPGTVTVNFSCDNFLIIAKQIMSLKGSDFFNEVSVAGIARLENGKLEMSLNLIIKNETRNIISNK